MATATRSRNARRASTPKVSTSTEGKVTTHTVTLPEDVAAPLLASLSEMNQTRKDAERAEKEFKRQLRAMVPVADLKKDERIVIRVAGAIRGIFNWRSRTGVDMDMLLSAYPEAFAACKTETTYEQFAPR